MLNLPPSPPRFPIIGNLHQLGTHPQRSFRALSDKYGPLMLIHIGQTPTLVVSSADMLREIINNHDIVFSSRPEMTAANLLYILWEQRRGLFSLRRVLEASAKALCSRALKPQKSATIPVRKGGRGSALAGSDGRGEMKDFVDILLGLQKDGKTEFELSDDNMKALIMDMFVGGTDSTLTALEWTMTELLRDPIRVMKKAQEEVRAVVGKKAKVDMNDVNQKDYLKCVIRETLRLHPPIPLLLPRETTASIVLEGYHIPANIKRVDL
ncbi:hypothetical protein TIFTF001_027715 [Ficus carica]|uniref:Cytochrome P450 n=1 Tax=Ficus carica TaxID=3494 RepID=A0AA88DGY2_FICCA|nr:hypothetical protein TIFTF001_026019 [Ficus carica]GMN58609.1 hypothetical protein TIFTF001_027715 [Ficus carica]